MRAKHLRQLVIIGMLLFGVSLPAAGLDLSLPDLGNPSTQVLSTAEEARIGRQMMNEIRTELDLVEDPAINAYIRALGARIATASESAGSPLQFFVLANDGINAFAMPGGYIGVHSGLITASTTESELGAVIAHEIAHITQRHIARRLEAATSSNLRSAALVIAGLFFS
ncbi:MAG: M48 family metalloprotease, partial [Gammaproteobacteria bacterium]|nr:M48 family metalloprotease [Gammaproteobacteria bacterium]